VRNLVFTLAILHAVAAAVQINVSDEVVSEDRHRAPHRRPFRGVRPPPRRPVESSPPQ